MFQFMFISKELHSLEEPEERMWSTPLHVLTKRSDVLSSATGGSCKGKLGENTCAYEKLTPER